MPCLHIRVSGSLDEPTTSRLATLATELTAAILGKDPALTAVVVEPIDPAQWFIAGRPLAQAELRSYHWSVSITDETNTKVEKARYIAAVHGAMHELFGEVAEHSYVHVADLRASAYGYGGQTQEARYHAAQR